jgi:ubiquinone/menaquinone biosynthesis C-methylase UbiE
MNTLQDYWNASSATLPDDKDPSAYAIEKEKLFPHKATVCDLGGGSGADGLYLASHGCHVILVDISDNGLNRALAAAAKQNLSQLLKTVMCNMEDGLIPLSNASCDIVYSRLALHYFERETLTRLLSEIYRILKSGGKAYLTLKSPADSAEMEYLKSTATTKGDGVFDENGHLKTRFTLEQLATMLRNAHVGDNEFMVQAYTENLGGRKDKVKSGNLALLLNEIQITKQTT